MPNKNTVAKADHQNSNVQELASIMEPDEIAETLGISEKAVIGILGRRQKRYGVVNNLTGQEFRTYTCRRSYFLAQLKGMTDYTLVEYL